MADKSTMNWQVDWWFTEETGDDRQVYSEKFHDMLSANKFYNATLDPDDMENPFSGRVVELATGYSYTLIMRCIGCARGEHLPGDCG